MYVIVSVFKCKCVVLVRVVAEIRADNHPPIHPHTHAHAHTRTRTYTHAHTPSHTRTVIPLWFVTFARPKSATQRERSERMRQFFEVRSRWIMSLWCRYEHPVFCFSVESKCLCVGKLSPVFAVKT